MRSFFWHRTSKTRTFPSRSKLLRTRALSSRTRPQLCGRSWIKVHSEWLLIVLNAWDCSVGLCSYHIVTLCLCNDFQTTSLCYPIVTFDAELNCGLNWTEVVPQLQNITKSLEEHATKKDELLKDLLKIQNYLNSSKGEAFSVSFRLVSALPFTLLRPDRALDWR